MGNLRRIITLGLLSQSVLIHAGAEDDLIFGDGFENCSAKNAVYWDGGGDGSSWSDLKNWKGDQLPADGASVLILPPGDITVIYDSSLATTRISCLQSEVSLTVTGGTLDLDGRAWVNADVTVSGGTLTATSDLAVSGAFQHMGGTVSGTGLITVAGLYTWTAGTQSGSGETVANGGLVLSVAVNSISLQSRTLTLNGASTWMAGELRLLNAATINNNATFEVQTDRRIRSFSGAISTFNNNGSLTKSAGTGVASIETHLNNFGTVSVTSGTLRLGQSSGVGTSEGAYQMAEGATLELQGSLTMLPASSFSGAGGLSFIAGGTTVIQGSYLASGPLGVSGGILTFDTDPVTVSDVTVSGGTLMATSDLVVSGAFQHMGGTVSGTGLITVAGLYTWTAGTQSGSGETVANGGLVLSVAVNSISLQSRTLTLNGASTWMAGQLRLLNAATINNNATFEIQTDSRMRSFSGAISTFNNNGSLTKSAGTGVASIETHLNNFGTVSVTSGSLSFGQTFLQDASASLDVSISSTEFDTYVISQSATLGGTLEIALLGGYGPAPGETFEIMTFASRIGSFDAISGAAIGNGNHFEVTYGQSSVTLEVVADP